MYVIKPRDHQNTGLYQGSADRSKGDRNSDLICILHQYHAIRYCNQSVLEIVPDLNIFFFSITTFDIISRIALAV